MEVVKRLVVGGLLAVCFLFVCALIGPGAPEPQEEIMFQDSFLPPADSTVQPVYQSIQPSK